MKRDERFPALAFADTQFWVGAAILAAMVTGLVHSIAVPFVLAADLIVFALALTLFRMTLGWNVREHAATVAVNQATFSEEIAEKREGHIHFLSSALQNARGEIAFLRAWLHLLPEATRVSEEDVIAEAERHRDAKREERKARARMARKDVAPDREVAS